MKNLSAQGQALLLALACFTLWSIGDSILKLVIEYKIPIHEIMAFHGLFTTFLLVSVVAMRRRLVNFRPQKVGILVVRALAVAGIVYCNFQAFALLPLANFYVIAFLSPLFVALFAALFLKEALSLKQIGIIVLGFIGAVMAIGPWSTKEEAHLLGYVFAAAGAICFSMTQILLRYLTKSENKECLIIFNRLFVGVVGLFFCLFSYVPMPLPVIVLLFFSSCASLIADFLMVTAMAKTKDAASISSLHYSQLITGALLGYLIWHDVPTWNVWGGGAVIVLAGLAMARLAHKQNTKIA